jgi:hypothetical protein
VKSIKSLLAAVIGLSATALHAVPELQLDIIGGTYDTSTETTLANSSVFTLRALVKGSSNLPGPYYISAAVEPAPEAPGSGPLPNVGSFAINGTSYSIGDLSYGVPPLNIPDDQAGDLPKHGIYPTYYKEVLFYFSPSSTVASYNVQDDAPAGGLLYYHDFTIDVTGLASGLNLHFDFYDEKVKRGVYTIDDFAPFSHDAASRTQVPDGGATVVMLGAAFLGAALFRRQLAKA